jgi:arsenate reductase
VEIVDITTTPPGPDELRQALSQLGRGRLFNTSGQSYRALGAERVKAMNDDQALAALSEDGRLIKRPFLVTSGGSILTGFKDPEWSKILA